MRKRMLYSVLMVLVLSFVFTACNSEEGSSQVDPVAESESSPVSTKQVDLSAQTIDTVFASLPEGLLGAVTSGGGDVDFRDLLGDIGLPENGTIYEAEGIVISVEGVSTEPPGILLGFVFDELIPVEGGG